MTTLQNIKCDLCGNLLKSNEFSSKTGIIQLSNKPTSNYNLAYTYEGLTKKGDLCLVCARKLRDFIENIKMEARP